MTENGGASPTDPRAVRFAFVSPLRYNHPMSQTAPPLATTATGAPAQSRLWNVLFRPVTPEQRNQRNVLIDAIGVGITAGVGSFLSVFMVRLGATDFQVGLLTAMPALTGMLLAMPAGEFLSRQRHIVPWFARSRFLVLICYVLTGLAPFSHPEPHARGDHPDLGAGDAAANAGLGGLHGGDGGRRRPTGRFTLMSRRWAILGLTNSLTVSDRRPDAHVVQFSAELPGGVHRLGCPWDGRPDRGGLCGGWLLIFPAPRNASRHQRPHLWQAPAKDEGVICALSGALLCDTL